MLDTIPWKQLAVTVVAGLVVAYVSRNYFGGQGDQ